MEKLNNFFRFLTAEFGVDPGAFQTVLAYDPAFLLTVTTDKVAPLRGKILSRDVDALQEAIHSFGIGLSSKEMLAKKPKAVVEKLWRYLEFFSEIGQRVS